MKKGNESEPVFGGESALAYARITFRLTGKPVKYLDVDGQELLFCGDDLTDAIDADVVDVTPIPQLPPGQKSSGS